MSSPRPGIESRGYWYWRFPFHVLTRTFAGTATAIWVSRFDASGVDSVATVAAAAPWRAGCHAIAAKTQTNTRRVRCQLLYKGGDEVRESRPDARRVNEAVPRVTPTSEPGMASPGAKRDRVRMTLYRLNR